MLVQGLKDHLSLLLFLHHHRDFTLSAQSTCSIFLDLTVKTEPGI